MNEAKTNEDFTTNNITVLRSKLVLALSALFVEKVITMQKRIL